MSMGDERGAILLATRQTQSIIAGLALGLLIQLGIFMFLRNQDNLVPQAPAPPSTKFFGSVALALALVGVAASVFIPPKISVKERRRIAQGLRAPMQGAEAGNNAMAQALIDDVVQLSQVYRTQVLVSAAILEGAAMFALLAYFLEGGQWVLILAVVLIGLVLSRFPTQTGVEAWIDGQLIQLDQDRGVAS
jgi:hypothetical protein